jgi:hypothetical protein
MRRGWDLNPRASSVSERETPDGFSPCMNPLPLSDDIENAPVSIIVTHLLFESVSITATHVHTNING